MLSSESRVRQEKLKACLYRLALYDFGEDKIPQMVSELKDLYSDGFRHSYAEFFPIVLDISKPENEYNADVLAEHLAQISQYIEQDYITGDKEFTRLYLPLLKLCDHLNLEIGRLNYYTITNNQVLDTQSKVRELTEAVDQSQSTLEDAAARTSSLQTEMLTILSIFSAVVLAFIGGMSFTGKTLESIGQSSIYRVSFIAIICGFVVFNTICGLMYIIAKITGRNIYTACSKPGCSCTEPASTCSPIHRLRLRLPYVFWVNVILISLLLLVVLAWTIDFRNAVECFHNILPWATHS
ncbi:hypothetical protein [Intestinibacillus massiliensis]|uniref:hypothetical protein n=1 Tax=Intestinibacillus massiliensis TaxID=1871029 RepID=UPI00117B25B2|nr:hypothetical protein [Intestinibacillus massiliensis]